MIVVGREDMHTGVAHMQTQLQPIKLEARHTYSHRHTEQLQSRAGKTDTIK